MYLSSVLTSFGLTKHIEIDNMLTIDLVTTYLSNIYLSISNITIYLLTSFGLTKHIGTDNMLTIDLVTTYLSNIHIYLYLTYLT